MSKQPSEGSIGVEQARREGRRWEFFHADDGWWFGPRPAGVDAVDLCSRPEAGLDSLQVLCATGYLQRCARNDDAARLFAVQTGCTLAEARTFSRDSEVAADAAFPPAPWPLVPLDAARDAAAQRRAHGRRGLIAYGVGMLVALAAVAVIVWLM